MTDKKPEEIEEKPISSIDVSKATRTVTEYLEGLYGNLNLLMFRLEDVRLNGVKNRYLVICSLLTNVGGPRRYYFVKVDITNGDILKISKGFRNEETGRIDWMEENVMKLIAVDKVTVNMGVGQSGEELKKAFNLRAPGYIGIKSSLYNIEKL